MYTGAIFNITNTYKFTDRLHLQMVNIEFGAVYKLYKLTWKKKT